MEFLRVNFPFLFLPSSVGSQALHVLWKDLLFQPPGPSREPDVNRDEKPSTRENTPGGTGGTSLKTLSDWSGGGQPLLHPKTPYRTLSQGLQEEVSWESRSH